MLKIEDLSAWLKSPPRSVVAPITLNRMPDSPDTVATISDYGGYPMEVEEALDVPTFQVRARAASGAAARDLAQQIDQLLLPPRAATRRFVPGNVQVVDAGRVGGAPSYLETDERNRTTYVCNYWLKIER